MKLQPSRGTRDLYFDEAKIFSELDQQFRSTVALYDFQEMQTPIFEFTQVFKRSLGDETDIVNKEMYSFEDRGGDSLTLRPEGTAPVARAVISNSLLRDLPLKLFYCGPMFRYERPQKGRFRQFTQFGIELIGVESPLADIEVLACAHQFFQASGLSDKVTLEINTIGDTDSRQAYREQLVAYFSKYKADLSEDSQTRLELNPLRILDSKDEKDKEIVAGAPRFADSLNQDSKEFYQGVCAGLDQLGIEYQENDRLVRGLDYYNHTVFEFTTTHLGSQNAVLSGGRYNHLIEQMGGPSTPGIGWAAGMDRLALLLEKPKDAHRSVAVIATDKVAEPKALELMQKLRHANIAAQPIYTGNVSKKLKKASKRNCPFAILIGEPELNAGTAQLKDFENGSQEELNLDSLIEKLKDLT